MDKTYSKQTYNAPLCETHVIIPEGLICLSGGGAGEYDEQHINDLGSWF